MAESVSSLPRPEPPQGAKPSREEWTRYRAKLITWLEIQAASTKDEARRQGLLDELEEARSGYDRLQANTARDTEPGGWDTVGEGTREDAKPIDRRLGIAGARTQEDTSAQPTRSEQGR